MSPSEMRCVLETDQSRTLLGWFKSCMPKYLYHYQRFDTENHRERLVQLLRDKKIYCSSASQFNDPWDCKPAFCTDDFHEYVKTTAGSKRYAGLFPDKKSRDLAEERIKTDPILRAKSLSMATKEIWDNNENKWRVYCLSSSATNIKMWSHYACGHTGICIEFDATRLPFSNAIAVSYRADFPKMLWSDKNDSARKIHLAKSSVWAEEDEYRLLVRVARYLQPEENFSSLSVEDHLLNIPESSVVSIIVGCQANVEAVRALVSEHSTSVVIKRATRVTDKYEVLIE